MAALEGSKTTTAGSSSSAAAWALVRPEISLQQQAQTTAAPVTSMHSDSALSLLDSFPRFFSIPQDMVNIPASTPTVSGISMAPAAPGSGFATSAVPYNHPMGVITSMGPEPNAGVQAMQTHVQPSLASDGGGGGGSAGASALFDSTDAQSERRQSAFLSSPQQPPCPAPLAFRTLSLAAISNNNADSTSMTASSPLLMPSSVGITSPMALAGIIPSPTASAAANGNVVDVGFSNQSIVPQAPSSSSDSSSSSATAAAAAAAAAAVAAAAVAAFRLSSPTTTITPLPPSSVSAPSSNGQQQQRKQAAAVRAPQQQSASMPPPSSSASKNTNGAKHSSIGIPNDSCTNSLRWRQQRQQQQQQQKARRSSLGARSSISATTQKTSAASARRATNRRRSGDWSRNIVDEEEVLDGLSAEGADNFGRPLFDVLTYPLPAKGDLDEHMNGVFEYFYMGVQTLHEVTFRKRVAGGQVSPVLIYAIMAVASRYSRRPSLHSLNGMAFLNGDRHASTSCGLASIQLNHGDLGTVDTIHGMLFLSVYFMGQGNMLKSRMFLVKAVCTARTMGFQNMDATFVPSNPMISFSGNFDRPHVLSRSHPPACSCPKSIEDMVELETKRRIWWFLVFVDYFTANVMNVPLEIPPDSYCVRLPCSDEEWMSPTLSMSKGTDPIHAMSTHRDAPSSAAALASGSVPLGDSISEFLAQASANSMYSSPFPDSLNTDSSDRLNVQLPRDLGFGDRLSSAQQSHEYLRLNGFHDCRPPWLYHPGAFYLERLMIEFCDHLRRLNNLRSLAIRSFFHADPVFVNENYPYLKRKRQFVLWAERLEKVKSSWSWLHLQLNKWLDSIFLRFSEVINRVPSELYNRQYRHQYYYYLIAAHSTIIMSHGVILQLYTDFSRYIRQQQQQQQQLANLQDHLGLRGQLHTPMTGNQQHQLGAQPAPWASPDTQTPHVDYSQHQFATATGISAATAAGLDLGVSGGLSEFGIESFGSAMAPLMDNITSNLDNIANGGGSSVNGSSIYGSVIGSPMSISASAQPHHHHHHHHHQQQQQRPTASAGIDDTMQSDAEMNEAGSRLGDNGFMSGLSLGLGGLNGVGAPATSAQPSPALTGANAASDILHDLSDMAGIAWEGCVSTAEQLALVLRGKHPKFLLLGGSPLPTFQEKVAAGDANILSQPGSAFNAPGTGPGADNPILSDPDFYMRLQPSTAWWMFLVAQVQVGHIKRLLKESEGCFKAAPRPADSPPCYKSNDAAAQQQTRVWQGPGAPSGNNSTSDGEVSVCPSHAPQGLGDRDATSLDKEAEEILGISQRISKSTDQMRPLSMSVNNSAIMLATAVHLSNSAPPPPNRHAMEKRASIKVRASRLVRAYENLSCMVKVLEGMQQYWQCMDYISVIQDVLKGSEHPLH
ncbi:hypothetical protein GQ54DRAFT_303205 [Martensiomyces pterosporus]|nr:hypothetical protein GQ54DRAFT_303205 [Martensiomyces pterosporus]